MNLGRGFLSYFMSYDIINPIHRAIIQYSLAYSNDIRDRTIQYDRSSSVVNVNII